MNNNQSTIEQLIAELCPNGVEFKKLGEVGTFIRGKRFVKKDILEKGTPCIHYGEMYTHYNIWANKSKSFVDPDLAKKLRVAQADDVVIVAAGETVEDIGKGVAWLGKEDVVVHDACFIFKHNLNPKYVSYFLQTNQFHSQIKRHISSGKISSINAKGLEKAKIPIPPPEVQQEIVDILDKFTQLEAELEAELEARKKQYEYYRDKMLTFGNDVERLPIEKIFNFKNGYTPSKSKSEYWENGDVPWFRMEDIRENGNILGKSIQLVNKTGVKGKGVFPENSIIIATSATIGEHALITIPHLTNQRFVSLSIKDEFKSELNIKFLFYYFFLVDEWCLKNTTKSSFASVDMSGFKKFFIPIPPISEQEKIVNTLDKFDALVNDISIGLPAEIKARRKQYEYYRGKLLTFNELEK